MAIFQSVIGKLKKGLKRTREGFVDSLRTVLLGKKLDDELIREIRACLIKADVGVAATDRLIESITEAYKAGTLTQGADVLVHLKDQLAELWPECDRSLKTASSSPTVYLVIGVNGAGKTTSIAKLAWLLKSQGNSVMLGACDTFRAGAVRQLEVWAERLGVDLIKGQQGGDPAAVAFDACQAANARKADVLILDTAGRLQTQDPLMRQLTKIKNVASKQVPGGPHEVLLVIDATAGQNGLRQAEAFAEASDVTGIILSKLDGTAKGGIVVAIRDAINIPVKFVGLGETPQDIEPFDPDKFIQAMFEQEG